jgi:hypothetical protein
MKHNDLFDTDNTTFIGRKKTCKACVSIIERKRVNSSFETQARKKIICSWKAHRNSKQVNKLSIEDGLNLLKSQQYICNHCKIPLEYKSFTTKKRNGAMLSLDRICTDTIGYGNGNSQWLCTSCNNGKNTMDNDVHLNKFKLRDNMIIFLKNENELLKLQLELMNKVQRLNGMGYESA